MDSRPATQEHIDLVNKLGQKFAEKLLARLEKHDASKLVEPELHYFDEGTSSLAKTEYGTPEYWAAKEAIQPGIDHHYEVNDHHPEHFEGGVGDMTLYSLLEMWLDWNAAVTRNKNGNIFASLETNTSRFKLSEQLASILFNTAAEDSPEMLESYMKR